MVLAFGEPNPTILIIILVLVLVLFGGKKIPELMRGLGKGVKEFKDASNNPSNSEGSSGNEEKKN